MQNKMRDKLIELLTDAELGYAQYLCEECDKAIKGDVAEELMKRLEFYADRLIENGAVIPPCKVGDIVYEISTDFTGTKLHIFERIVSRVEIVQSKCILYYCPWKEHKLIGKHYYLTKEQAEQKLRELSDCNG